MHVPNSLYYLNLARTSSFEPWDGGVTITTDNITFDTSGYLGKVGSTVPIFNGISSYARLVFSESRYNKLLASSEISFGGWFYIDNITSSPVFYHLGDSLTEGIVLQAINNNLKCIIGTYDSDYDDCIGVLSTGWHHIFVTCTTSQRIIYVDGEPVNETNKTYSFSALSDIQYIGAFNGTSNFWKGRLQMFHFSSSCLSRKQVKLLAEAATYLVPLFDVNTGYGLDDYSGNSRDPSAYGSFTLDTSSPRYTAAVKFSGNASKYVVLGSCVRYIQFGFTMSVRFKTNVSGTAQVLLDNGYSSPYGIRLLIGSSNEIRVNYGNGTTTHSFNGPTIETDTWYMFTVTWNGSTIKLYLNGVLEYEEAYTTPVVASSSSLPLIVGKASYQYGNTSYSYAYPLNGSICDIRVYCTPLSAQKIYELYSIPIQLDDKGTLWGFQLVQNETQTSFTSKGIVATGTFISTNDTSASPRISQTEIQATYFDHI